MAGAPDDEGAGEGEERVSGGVEAFVADLQAAEEDEPGEGGFDDPAAGLAALAAGASFVVSAADVGAGSRARRGGA